MYEIKAENLALIPKVLAWCMQLSIQEPDVVHPSSIPGINLIYRTHSLVIVANMSNQAAFSCMCTQSELQFSDSGIQNSI